MGGVHDTPTNLRELSLKHVYTYKVNVLMKHIDSQEGASL
jgi:hypothetical protein